MAESDATFDLSNKRNLSTNLYIRNVRFCTRIHDLTFSQKYREKPVTVEKMILRIE